MQAGPPRALQRFYLDEKMSEGDPGRAAAAALTFDHTKNVFVFDEDIDVFNPTDILWAIATRVQPHIQVSILQPLFRGNLLIHRWWMRSRPQE